MAKGIKTGGRQKGTPNKVTADVKSAILSAFTDVGGAEYLRGIAVQKPEAFCTLLGKVLPKQIEMDAEIEVTGGVDRPPTETRKEWLERKQREALGVVAAAGSAD